MTLSNLNISRDRARRPNFRQRRIVAFTALWRYAKIAPAALHRGKFDERCGEGTEAVGRRPKFGLGDFRRAAARSAMPIPPAAPRGRNLSKACPAAARL